MKPVFISYSSKDRDFVDRLRADLQADGINVWIDHTGLKPRVVKKPRSREKHDQINLAPVGRIG